MRRTIGLAALLLALAALAAGCSGDDDEAAPAATEAPATTGAAPAGPGLTQAQLVEQADAICKEELTSLRSLPAAKSVDELPVVMAQGHEIVTSMISRLRKLEPPPADAKAYDGMVAAFEKSAQVIDRTRRAAEEQDTAALQRLGRQSIGPSDRAAKLAKQLGLTACAEPI